MVYLDEDKPRAGTLSPCLRLLVESFDWLITIRLFFECRNNDSLRKVSLGLQTAVRHKIAYEVATFESLRVRCDLPVLAQCVPDRRLGLKYYERILMSSADLFNTYCECFAFVLR